MASVNQYRTLAAGAMQARRDTNNDRVAESQGRAAASFDSAARNLDLAERKKVEARTLARLANRHRERGRGNIAQAFEERAVKKASEAEFLVMLSSGHASEAVTQQSDALDANVDVSEESKPPRRRRGPHASNEEAEGNEEGEE